MGGKQQRESTAIAFTEEAVPHVRLPKPARRKPRRRLLIWLVLFILLAAATVLVAYEMRTSQLQARQLSRYASTLTYSVESGPSDAIHYPGAGPFDKRLGYSSLPTLLERLQQRDFIIEQQAQFSPALLDYSRRGFFTPYQEKTQAGLVINDCRAEPIYRHSYPRRHYADFSAIPPLVLQALLFVENKELLNNEYAQVNPAVDWPRFAKAALSQVGRALDIQDDSAGGSTLATQVEKYRHSPNGLTVSPKEKLRQMISASVRAYQDGPETLAARQEIALAYLNSVPLAAAPGYGEIHGVGDGLWVWYGADFNRVNQLLTPDYVQTISLDEQGLALRQVLSLMIAHRRPSYYLVRGRDELASLTDSYLRLLARDGLISQPLRDAALAQPLNFRDFRQASAVVPIDSNKGLQVARSRLGGLLGLTMYDLDRLDLSASTTLQDELQQQVTDYLHRLADPDFAREIGLYGERLLSPEKTQEVNYSFTLFERGPHSFQVRVQTDNTHQPFDINEGSKLELGSTAKLRVLTTYLEIIAELHQRYAGLGKEALRQVEVDPQDLLSRWAVDYLLSNPQAELAPMLQAALNRRYSASTGERFFTGGGIHTFHNFRKEDNGRNPTLMEALRESINLPFVRLMRDIVRYSIHLNENRTQLLADDKDPRRREYLSRFADREGRVFLLRFWRKYQGKDEQTRLDTFFDGLRATPTRLAAVHRYLMPDADPEAFAAFLHQRLPNESLTDKRIADLYHRYGPGAYSLPDQGYIARVHPLELWLLGYLQNQPQASYSDAAAASQEQRQEVYGWLFKTRHRSARDNRIRTMLEVEAFLDIHQRWQRLGFPFDHLVPSLATAIGSSGDRPAALAELMGIILNDGIRLPTVRIDGLHFAEGTPYETRLGRDPSHGQRVMPAEVAAALRNALSDVVEGGTARRLQGSFKLEDGTPLTLGGKTGTGDNRIETVSRYGQVLSSQARNRTATFVFYLGESHFGTLTAYVPGSKSDKFRFTSALPVQVLKGMEPLLRPYLTPDQNSRCQPPRLIDTQTVEHNSQEAHRAQQREG
ncbi:transglycosylase domain-containing protein [Zobellella maritima]|uniref:transglycosylase domain-containing protein n=1 Tax=Zobellella maritima TaxID=2059725 RepID=UPI000E30A1F3|nr:transglycosylase domain-containing protein [Zobellella maritima]